MNSGRNQGNTFRFSQTVMGQERKIVAAVIAEVLGEQMRYTGAPGFAYAAGGWTVDRGGAVHSPVIPSEEIRSIRPVVEALNTAGLQASGNMTLALSAGEHSEQRLRTLETCLPARVR